MIDTKQLEADLKDKNKDQAEVIKNLVQAIDEIVLSNQEMKRLADDAAKIAEDTSTQATSYFNAMIDLTDTIKNIYVVLNSGDEKTIAEMKLELAKWVLDNNQIKLGVVSKALKEKVDAQ